MLDYLIENDISLTAAAAIAGGVLGVAFGIIAQISRFCLRRGLVGSDETDRQSALATWGLAFATAILATQVIVTFGGLSLSDHRFLSTDLQWAAIILGGVLFGAGMVLTRGCASRLTVLAGQGNTRALISIVTVALIAHATMKGVLAPIRVAMGAITVQVPDVSSLITAVPGGGVSIAVVIAISIGIYAWGRVNLRDGLLGIAIGLLVPAGWYVTGVMLNDPFDPIALESIGFMSPGAETLFWTIASTSVGAGFGVGFVGGVLTGAAGSAITRKEWQGESFSSPLQTGRYLSGGVLMGFGGVLAGGCTIGAGLSGAATLSIAAFLALGAIVLGAKLTARLLSETSSGFGAPTTTQVKVSAA